MDFISTLTQVLLGVAFVFAVICTRFRLRNLDSPIGPILGFLQMVVGGASIVAAAIYLLMGLWEPSALGFIVIVAGVLLIVGGYLFVIGKENRFPSE